jgi:acetoacetyl-CoA synthetase
VSKAAKRPSDATRPERFSGNASESIGVGNPTKPPAKPIEEGTMLWEPSEERKQRSQMFAYVRWLEERTGENFTGYQDVWQWSVRNIEAFWQSIVDFFEVPLEGDPRYPVLDTHEMLGARFFEGRKLNYLQALLAAADRFSSSQGSAPSIVVASEGRPLREVGFDELCSRVALVQQALEELGVGLGDRVAAYLPNNLDALVAFLAAAGLGAIWSCCSPDFGTRAVLDRFGQIQPKVLLATPGYFYGGRYFDRTSEIASVACGLEGLESVVLFGPSSEAGDTDTKESAVRSSRAALDSSVGEIARMAPGVRVISLDELVPPEGAPEKPRVVSVPFGHPLWILYSSGTTGLPKPIVHGHGGIVLEHLKALALHMDLGPQDTFFWYTNTGWMMWNFLISGLLVGSRIVLYDGSPMWPDAYALWRLAEQARITCFGVSGPYIHAAMKQGVVPKLHCDMSRIATVGSTGAPLSPEGFAWLYETVGNDLLVASISGGTDVCTAFVGSCPLLPVHAGEIQCRFLGAAVDAFDEEGNPVVGDVGELVVTEPMPSMPLYFWGDQDMSRYKDAYFSHYKGVWRHGDWIKITERGSCVIYGRSDATLNRAGVRMGTAEFYRVVEALDEIEDSLVVDVPIRPESGALAGKTGEDNKGGDGSPKSFGAEESRLFLFVVPAPGHRLDAALEAKIRDALRSQLSPRHVPDEIVEVRAVPKTINAKKMEVPVKRILMGQDPEVVASQGAMANPESLADYVDYAVRYRQRSS